MRKKFFSLLIVGLAAAIIVGVVHCRDRDERQIKKNLTRLAVWVSKSRNESELVTLGKNQRLISLFARDCRINLSPPVPDIQGRESLASAVQIGKQTIKWASVRFRDVTVTVEKDRSRAKTKMTALASVPEPGRTRTATEARELEMEWRKIDGAWKIAAVNEIAVFR